MPSARRPTLAALAAVLLGAILFAGCTSTATLDEPATTATTGSDATTSTVGVAVAPTDTTSSPSTTAKPPSLPPDVQAQVDEAIATVERLRRLTFLSPPRVVLVPPDEVEERIRAQLAKELEPEETARDDALLTLLGVLDPDVDLFDLYVELYGEQAAAFYDGEAKELVVPYDGGELDAFERFTLVHELVHALTDQHFAFDERSRRLDEEARYDEAAALLALIEGDATLTQALYARDLSPMEVLELQEAALGYESDVFDAAPRFLQHVLLFPYEDGADLVAELWIEGGFGLVDAAYLDPPISTEQVYHPSRYLDREAPLPVGWTTPGGFPPGYEPVESSTWGELGLHAMLLDRLDTGIAVKAADGWGGDAYTLLWDGTSVAFVLVYRGDSEAEAEEVRDGLGRMVEARMRVGEPIVIGDGWYWADEDLGFVVRHGDTVVFVAADDPEVGKALARAYAEGP